MRSPKRHLKIGLVMAALVLLVTFAALALVAVPAYGVEPLGQFIAHSPTSKYYTIVSDKGETLSKISLTVTPGDYLVTEDNRGWKIYAVDGQTAKARFDKRIDLDERSDRPPLSEVVTGWISGLLAQASGGKKTIGLYHTHSDEAYVPTTGKASMKMGDIYRVGDTLAAELRSKGFRVVHSYNNHNPHDAAAYHRSRRTVAEMMKLRPSALIDVHRDAIPDPKYYAKRVSGREIAQVRLVVGKQNANRAVNFDFAKKIKADASRIHPGLVKEIFWAKGDYNQDVAPRAILLEFGTHTNSQTMARRGASLMADVLPVAITGQGTAGGGATRGSPDSPRLVRSQSRTGTSSAIWLILVAVGGGLIFLAVNAGGIGGIGRQLKKFTGQELSGFLGRRRKEDKDCEAGLDAENKCVSVDRAEDAPKDGGETDPGR